MLKIKRFLDYKRCSFCGIEFLGYDIEKINGTNYICQNCRCTKSYHERNEKFKGKEKDISFSFEFETSKKSNDLYELLKYGFIGCSDCSIGGLEWKSEIYYSKKTFHSICQKIDKFSRYVGHDCGTHLHVATKYKNIIKEFEKELFLPILKEMVDNKNATIKFWGRYFNSYCSSIINNSRYNAFNTRSSVGTLEFRLLKFVNANQYIRASDFCIDTTKFINNCIEKNGLDSERASKIGNIILEKYKEAIKVCAD